MGHTSKGKFRDFKIHAVVNQNGLPLRVTVTPGNQFDGPFLAEIIEDQETDYILADGLIVQNEIFKLSETWVLCQLPLITLAGKAKHVSLSRMCF